MILLWLPLVLGAIMGAAAGGIVLVMQAFGWKADER